MTNSEPNADKNGLAERYMRPFDHSWRFTMVSLFCLESIGARAIYTFLKACGYETDLIFLKEHALNRFDMPTDKELGLFFKHLEERKTNAVGLSVRSPYIGFACELTRLIHEKLGVPVIWGGTAATVTPELCIKGGADYAICGEGEEAIAELAGVLGSGGDPTEVKNVWYKGPDGPVGNPLRPLLQDLDALPMLDLEADNKFVIEFDKLVAEEPWHKWRRYEIASARGCPYKCTYCSNSLFHGLYQGLGRFVRVRSVESVLAELEYAKSKIPKMKNVFFSDEVFGAKADWLSEFCEKFPKRIGLQFECTTDARALNDEKVRMMKEAGLAEVNIGLQAGADTVRQELFDRRVTNERYLEIANIINRHGVFARYDIIADNPFETAADKEATLDLLLKLPKPFILNLYSLNYFPRTKLTDLALERGIITEDDVVGESDKCLKQFCVSFDYPRAPEDECWFALFTLSSKSFIPRGLLRWISKKDFFKRHPKPVVALARASSLLRVFAAGLKLLATGRIDFNYARRFLRSIGSLAR